MTADPATGPISLADAARHPLLLPGPRSGIQQVTQEIFKQRGLNITLLGEIDIVYTLRKIVESGVANTILPWSALYDGRERTLNYRRFADVRDESGRSRFAFPRSPSAIRPSMPWRPP